MQVSRHFQCLECRDYHLPREDMDSLAVLGGPPNALIAADPTRIDIHCSPEIRQYKLHMLEMLGR